MFEVALFRVAVAYREHERSSGKSNEGIKCGKRRYRREYNKESGPS